MKDLKKMATITTVAKRVLRWAELSDVGLAIRLKTLSFKTVARYFFRRNVSLFSLPIPLYNRVVRALDIHRMGDAVLLNFKRVGLFRFYDDHSGYTFYILFNEID
jgi:hypothetical protein